MPKTGSRKKSKQGVGASAARWEARNTNTHTVRLPVHDPHDSEYYPSQEPCTQSTVDETPAKRRCSRRLQNKEVADDPAQISQSTPKPSFYDSHSDD